MATLQEMQQAIEVASEQELVCILNRACTDLDNNPEDLPEPALQAITYFSCMVVEELERRKVEPLWRKAKRFAVRNSGTFKEIGKVAAGVALGVLICDDLTS